MTSLTTPKEAPDTTTRGIIATGAVTNSSDADATSDDKIGAVATDTTRNAATSTAFKKKVMKQQSSSVISYRRAESQLGMESSVFSFQDVNFVVGKGDKQKNILTGVNGKVKWGHVLAVMGPSGAGKTTLISALTLDAFYGRPTGSVTLNGVRLTNKLFKRHCYVMKQQDKHWPYLSCRETLHFAAQLYNVAENKDIPLVVEETIQKMGLGICADTRAARLSGGQARRLSIGIALLKQPTLLFLDEPTSGLDAAAANNIMQEIVRVAKDERLIIMCSIHQPSTKVYNGFDEVMLLSKGREAFSGKIKSAPGYFDEIGYPIPEQMNPAEHFLDLVNADFSSPEEVDTILDKWELNSRKYSSFFEADVDVQEGVVDGIKRNYLSDLRIMFRRHFLLIIRDPVLYVGRAFIILITNTVFGLVYWKARDFDQAQAINKHFLNIWFIGVATNMGVVAVYALNDEFKSVMRESKNGMVQSTTYVWAKSVMVIPVIFIICMFALLIPGFVIQQYSFSSFGAGTLLWSAMFFCFENVAECLAVWFEDPIMGMMMFMNFWFMCFLFSGTFLSSEILYYPFEIFYYILPFSYYLRSIAYIFLHDATWEACNGGPESGQPVCVEDGDPIKVLEAMSLVYSVVSSDDTVAKDIVVIVAIALFFKIAFVVGVIYKTRRVASIN